jgi:hypothetical protein
LHCRSARGPGRFNRLMRLCPSIHTFSHERIPSGHSGERAVTSRPLVRPSGRTCESNHYAALSNRLPCPVGLVGSPCNSKVRLKGFFNSLLGAHGESYETQGDDSPPALARSGSRLPPPKPAYCSCLIYRAKYPIVAPPAPSPAQILQYSPHPSAVQVNPAWRDVGFALQDS